MDLTTSQLTMTELSDIQRHGLSDLENVAELEDPPDQGNHHGQQPSHPNPELKSHHDNVNSGPIAVGKVTNSRLFGGSRHKDQSEQAKQPAEKEPVSTQPTQTVYVTMAQTSTTALSTSAEPVTNVEPEALLASQNAAPIIKMKRETIPHSRL
ncbi:hypothetical protein BASA83_004305 [Batrachochytrium salamandrivorans]|nr:hypothetical protein BASA83_004305 [Batrachochytrium salamandrivorans]